jgi:hypothetical protein
MYTPTQRPHRTTQKPQQGTDCRVHVLEVFSGEFVGIGDEELLSEHLDVPADDQVLQLQRTAVVQVDHAFAEERAVGHACDCNYMCVWSVTLRRGTKGAHNTRVQLRSDWRAVLLRTAQLSVEHHNCHTAAYNAVFTNLRS